MVEGRDRGGAADGNSATCSLEIKILDVNDNLPVLESSAVSTFTMIFGVFVHLLVSHCLRKSYADFLVLMKYGRLGHLFTFKSFYSCSLKEALKKTEQMWKL